MTSVDETASRLVRGPDLPNMPGSAYLLVVQNDSSQIVHLPQTGAFVIGRTREVDLGLEHPSVSRRHAAIRIDAGVMRIADLGSHNGTRVNGELVQESRVLASGDVVGVGDVVIVVHVSKPPVISRATLTETTWRRRLDEEIERATSFHRSLAVLVVPGVPPSTLDTPELLRLIDILGETGDGGSLVLMPEVDREQATTRAERLLQHVRAAVPAVRIGIAMCPGDAADSDTILLAARKAAQHATPSTVADANQATQYIQLGDRRVTVLDPAMSRVYKLLERLASSPTLAVLITGETGVGKENAAYAVHHWSKRTGPFVPVNCASISESLAESELFGHEKGAFTGAVATKAGYFETAAGGTLFLDELGELPANIQAKLLRVIETRKITRVGDTRERPIDVRFVSATRRDLAAEVRAGTFRVDLLQRINAATVILPPLRDRRCEIPVLAREFLARFCREAGKPPKQLAPETMQLLLAHSWPGNVRELRNVIEYAVATVDDDRVEPSDLEERIATGKEPPRTVTQLPEIEPPATFRPINDELKELERRRMVEALVAAKGVKTRAAQLIDMPIRTFTLKCKQYGLA